MFKPDTYQNTLRREKSDRGDEGTFAAELRVPNFLLLSPPSQL